MAKMSLNKLVAINSYNANCNMLREMEYNGEENSVLYLITLKENQRLEKRYPSLKTSLYV